MKIATPAVCILLFSIGINLIPFIYTETLSLFMQITLCFILCFFSYWYNYFILWNFDNDNY